MLNYDPKIHKDYEERNLPRFTSKPVGMKKLIMSGLKFPQNTENKIGFRSGKRFDFQVVGP